MNRPLGPQVRFVRILRRRIAANVVVDAFELDRCLESVPVFCDSKESADVPWLGGSLVLHVHGRRNITQICNPIVRLVSVDVVNISSGPHAEHVQPCETMRPVELVLDTDPDVSGIALASCFTPRSAVPASLGHGSREYPSFGIVVKKIAQRLRSERIGVSHDALQLLIGQRPRRVGSTSRPRHSIPLPVSIDP